MNKETSNIIATVLGVVGIIFILAMAFGIMQRTLALFIGVVCFVIAGAVRTIGSR